MNEIHLDRWIPLSEAAELACEPLWKFRRRIYALNEQHGGKLLSKSGGKRQPRRYVSAEGLLHCMRTNPGEIDAERVAVMARLEDLTRRLQSTRDSQNAFRKKAWDYLNQLEKRLTSVESRVTQSNAE